MKYDFLTSINRENTGAIKSNPVIVKNSLGLNYYDDSISMWVADMDFPCAPEIVNAIKDRADKLVFGYSQLTNEYKDSVINWYKTRHGAEFSYDDIIYCNGTVNAIKHFINAFSNEGDEVIIQSPVYYPFAGQVNGTKRVVSNNCLIKDENNVYSIDFADFEEKCKTAKLFIYCNPHNPIGKIWSKEESQKLIDIANKYNVLVFSDEVHSDLIRNNEKFASALTLDNSENVVVATAINKTFNLADLQGTNIIIKNEELRAKFEETKGKLTISPFTSTATVAAYNKCAPWLDELKCVLDENFAYMKEFIDNKLPKLKYNIPAGSYLAWIDFSGYNMEEQKFLELLADEAHVILEDGKMFGENGKGFLRMNLALPKSDLVEALNRIYNVLK